MRNISYVLLENTNHPKKSFLHSIPKIVYFSVVLFYFISSLFFFVGHVFGNWFGHKVNDKRKTKILLETKLGILNPIWYLHLSQYDNMVGFSP